MDTDVVVIGAGAAGLAAALQLAQRSIRVVALEARERVGGRVRWEPVGSVDVPAELGAEFIHGDAPETSALLRAAGLENVATGDASWMCDSAGDLRPADDDFRSGDIFDQVRSLTADESVESFLLRFEHDPGMREEARRARAFVEGFEAADPRIASVRSIADELQSGVDSTSSRPVGSYAPLFTYLAGRCRSAGVDLRLDTAVERVTWNTAGVTVEGRSNGRDPFSIRARCAIVTVPVGVLQQREEAAPLEFVPPLPEQKQTALRGLAMGHAVRVTLAFRTPFWETLAGGRYRDAAFFRCEAAAFNAFWTQLPLRNRTIVAWAGGPRATAMRDEPAAERVERARDAFGSMLGAGDTARREFEGGVTHDWSTDRFACGAYSYVVTGGGTARADLGVPVAGTLFFAGEATSTDGQGGTVSGALQSGMRAATEVAATLDRADTRSETVP
jgi:monoamine oxidase